MKKYFLFLPVLFLMIASSQAVEPFKGIKYRCLPSSILTIVPTLDFEHENAELAFPNGTISSLRGIDYKRDVEYRRTGYFVPKLLDGNRKEIGYKNIHQSTGEVVLSFRKFNGYADEFRCTRDDSL